MLSVHCPIEGTYAIHEPGQPSVEGVAVWHYGSIDAWACEEHGSGLGRQWPECEHVRLAKEYRRNA